MTDSQDTDGAAAEWSLRPWLLATLFGIAGVLVWWISDDFHYRPAPWRAALTALTFFAPFALAFTLEPNRRAGPLLFAALIGVIMAGIAWRVASAEPGYDTAGFWLAAGIVAIALALPLFQAGFHRRRWQTSYAETHYFVWTDAISAGGALAFVGLAWLVAVLLSQLFQAIEIDFLRELLRESWFGWLFSGVAFGAALGTLRNQIKVLGTLQKVVMLVFALLAVPLAIALVLFLLAVALSGLDVLWEATRSATPLLLSFAAGSFVLANTVLRDSDVDASGSRIMRGAALVLALGILPLSILAAISMGTRIAQHGLSPERIWGLIAILVAVFYGVAYFVAGLRSLKHGWDRLRQANLHLAVATCVLALLLAMPVLDFGAIAARNQIGRLAAGKVSAEDFDYYALRWDFGDAGRKALAKLTGNSDPEVARLAAETQAEEARPSRWNRESTGDRTDRLGNLRMMFDDPALRKLVTSHIQSNRFTCTNPCVVFDLGPVDEKRHKFAITEQGMVNPITLSSDDDSFGLDVMGAEVVDEVPEQAADSTVEIREWTGRRVYIDGKPVGQPFE